MESVVSRSAVLGLRLPFRLDPGAIWIWALAGSLVLYLGLDGGGYDLVVRNDTGVVVWWVVLLGAACGVLPSARLTRSGWAAVALLGGFAVWSAIASSWSLSSDRSLAEVSRLACYLGVLVLAVTTYGERNRALRHVVGAVASAVVVLAAIAVLSRLRPGLFPSAQATASFLPRTHARLSWPLNYWNALGAMVALGLPLLLCIATSARRLVVQAAAAAAVPLMALCGYLTLSRGAALAAAAGLIVFIVLAPDRLPKLGTLMLCAAGSAALIAGAVHRYYVEQGITNAAARHQGSTLLVAVIIVCAGVALAQVGIGLAARHGTLPKVLQVSRRRASTLLAATVLVGLIAAFAAHGPSHLQRVWHDFKQPLPASLYHHNPIERFGSLSGNDRYTYWKVAIDATPGHLLGGWGPGTYQLVWMPRAPFWDYISNAHSLYVETLSDVGIVGLVLLGAFLLLVIGVSVRRVAGRYLETRPYAAAVAAASVAFAVSAAFDWTWQVPVLPVAMLLLGAAALTPQPRGVRRTTHPAPAPGGSATPARARLTPLATRGVLIAVALASLIAIGIPLGATNDLRQSQAAAGAGNTATALADARSALAVEPGSAAAQLQVALVLELQGRTSAAAAAARAATADEPQNWQTWLVLSRLQGEAGHPRAAVAALRRARSLNPRSPLFVL